MVFRIMTGELNFSEVLLRWPNTVLARAFALKTCCQQSDHFIYSTPALSVLFFSIIAWVAGRFARSRFARTESRFARSMKLFRPRIESKSFSTGFKNKENIKSSSRFISY